ncbi:DUF262 domain-containing protein [Micromonospora sp. SL4-19]|uniref:DUF262 domain-containing protein n=1 Tax=Micromonospora sp. SL4-19 TaxID=3399129 RepID=UPI003A4DE6DA
MIDDEWAPENLDIERSSYAVVEFVEWDEAGKLELSPAFQRGEVWRTPAKAFLIDTILRNFPIPPLHIRLVSRPGKGMVREVIDGQQRLNAVLQYVRGDFTLPARPTAFGSLAPWAGLKFEDLDEAYQQRIHNYSFRCEVYKGNIADALVHEIFSRINIHSIPLSDQELRNGKFFGEFKQSVYLLSREYSAFWKATSLFSEQAIARMLDAQFVSEALVLQLAGMQDKKKTIDSFYTKFDTTWSDRLEHEERFRATMDSIRGCVGEVLKQTKFRRVPLFYTLYAVVYHRLFGIDSQRVPERVEPLPLSPRTALTERKADNLRNTIEILSSLLENPDSDGALADFFAACSQQTDNIRPRLTRFHNVWNLAALSER